MFTREDYMHEYCTIWQFYEQFIKTDTYYLLIECVGCRKIGSSQDIYLNDIALKIWDQTPDSGVNWGLAKSLGANHSLCVKVLVYKAAARQLRNIFLKGAFNEESLG